MTMKDWADHLVRILTMSGEQLLLGNGSISHKQAVDKATDELSICICIPCSRHVETVACLQRKVM